MFQEFSAYVNLGIEHILDINGFDHVLFLIVLAIPFTIKNWKTVIVLATAFTIGHSLTLFLSGMDLIRIKSEPVEILIAISILFTAIFNILKAGKAQNNISRYSIALFFGLIHGLGFSNFFKSILGNDAILFPLFSFNIGVELAQVIIVIVILIINKLIIDILNFSQNYWIRFVSIAIGLWSIQLIFDRI